MSSVITSSLTEPTKGTTVKQFLKFNRIPNVPVEIIKKYMGEEQGGYYIGKDVNTKGTNGWRGLEYGQTISRTKKIKRENKQQPEEDRRELDRYVSCNLETASKNFVVIDIDIKKPYHEQYNQLDDYFCRDVAIGIEWEVDLVIKHFGNSFMTRSTGSGAPHLWRLRHPKDKNTTDTKIQIEGLQKLEYVEVDLVYKNSFEDLECKMENCEGEMPVFEGYNNGIQDHLTKSVKKGKRALKNKTVANSLVGIPEIKKYLDNISKSYLDDRGTWLKIMWAIFNETQDYNLCMNYCWSTVTMEELIKEIESDKTKDCTLGTIIHFSKESNPDRHQEIWQENNTQKSELLTGKCLIDDEDEVQPVPPDDEDDKDDDPFPVPKELGINYKATKLIHEETDFILLSPFKFCSTYIDENNEKILTMYNASDYKYLTLPLKYINPTINRDGGVSYLKQSFFKAWLQDEKRKWLYRVDFFPNMKTAPKDVYNLFDGFLADKIEDTEEKNDGWEIFKNHVYHLSGGEKEAADFFLKWIAHIIQYPEILPGVGVFIQSQEGAGKDALREWIARIIGKKYTFATSDMEQVFGQFNFMIRNKLLIQINEMDGKAAFEKKSSVKNFITAETVSINQKNISAYEVNNYARVLGFTNDLNFMHVGEGARRFMILQSHPKRDKIYYDELWKNIKSKAACKSVYKELLKLDLSDFDVRCVPKTRLFYAMQKHNIDPIYEFVYSYLTEGENATKFDIEVSSTTLMKDCIDWHRENGHNINFINSRNISKHLCQGLKIPKKKKKRNKKNRMCFIMDKSKVLDILKSNFDISGE